MGVRGVNDGMDRDLGDCREYDVHSVIGRERRIWVPRRRKETELGQLEAGNTPLPSLSPNLQPTSWGMAELQGHLRGSIT